MNSRKHKKIKSLESLVLIVNPNLRHVSLKKDGEWIYGTHRLCSPDRSP